MVTNKKEGMKNEYSLIAIYTTYKPKFHLNFFSIN
jgi:hypothetical protein